MLPKPLAKITARLMERSAAPERLEDSEPEDASRGIHKLDMKTCTSCSACANICPNDTIAMVETETDMGTKLMPEINLDRCLFCALCEEVCPPKCLTLTKDYSFEGYDRREFIKRPEELE